MVRRGCWTTIMLATMLLACKSKEEEDYTRGIEAQKAGRLPEARAAFEAAKTDSKAAEELAKIDDTIASAIKAKLVGRDTDMFECGELSRRITGLESSTVTQAAPAAETSGEWLVTAHVKGTCAGITCKGMPTSECLDKITAPNQTKPFTADFMFTLTTTKLGEVSVSSFERRKK